MFSEVSTYTYTYNTRAREWLAENSRIDFFFIRPQTATTGDNDVVVVGNRQTRVRPPLLWADHQATGGTVCIYAAASGLLPWIPGLYIEVLVLLLLPPPLLLPVRCR